MSGLGVRIANSGGINAMYEMTDYVQSRNHF